MADIVCTFSKVRYDSALRQVSLVTASPLQGRRNELGQNICGLAGVRHVQVTRFGSLDTLTIGVSDPAEVEAILPQTFMILREVCGFVEINLTELEEAKGPMDGDWMGGLIREGKIG